MKEMISIFFIIVLGGMLLSCKSETYNSLPASKNIESDILTKTESSTDHKEKDSGDINKDELLAKAVEEKSSSVGKTRPDTTNLNPTPKRTTPPSEKMHKKHEVVVSVKEEIKTTAIPQDISNVSNAPTTDDDASSQIEEIAPPKPKVENTSAVIPSINEQGDQDKLTESHEQNGAGKKFPTPLALDMHKDWNYLLKTYVSADGNVNYQGLRTEKNRLESYLALISNNPPSSDWSRNKKLAYWINAYNAYTVKLIIDNYPLKSITDLEGGKPWDKKWINIGGKTYSLNNIENDIIRPEFNEPRIHFAVNCAAKSCPPLRNEAWDPERLEQQLESSTKKFIENKAYNTIATGNAKVSKIFEWYAVDFGDLKSFLQKYSGQDIDKISYEEYDWNLNK